jgi:hypothetical protein
MGHNCNEYHGYVANKRPGFGWSIEGIRGVGPHTNSQAGNAFTLVKWDEFRAIKDIEDLIKKPIDWDGEAPTDEEIAESIASKGRRRRGSKAAGPKSKPAAKRARPEKVEEKVQVVEKQEQSPVEATPDKRPSEEKPQRERGSRGRGRGGKGRDNNHDDTPSMFTEENMPAFLARPVI